MTVHLFDSSTGTCVRNRNVVLLSTEEPFSFCNKVEECVLWLERHFNTRHDPNGIGYARVPQYGVDPPVRSIIWDIYISKKKDQKNR